MSLPPLQPEHPARGMAKTPSLDRRIPRAIPDPPLGWEWRPAPVELLQLVLDRLREL